MDEGKAQYAFNPLDDSSAIAKSLGSGGIAGKSLLSYIYIDMCKYIIIKNVLTFNQLNFQSLQEMGNKTLRPLHQFPKRILSLMPS